MQILKLGTLFIFSFVIAMCNTTEISSENSSTSSENEPKIEEVEPAKLMVGAERTSEYLPILKDKKVALVVNQTSTIGETHLVDSLLSLNVMVEKIFAPEHGFRGGADAGETVVDQKDTKTGLPIKSLYGSNKKPSQNDLAGIDMVIFDIQDVGARFYTYISTMHYVMEACAENGVDFMVLDRPNPNGYYVDGPVLEMEYQSFVGMHAIPVVHGLTVAELANMINGERWLKGSNYCKLTYITCANYDHTMRYDLPIKPSPNLPNARSIELYPSICFLEATPISCGRGTHQQFQVIGDPDINSGTMHNDRGYLEFTPESMDGAKYPKHENKLCYGYDLSMHNAIFEDVENQINLAYILGMYEKYPNKDKFFTSNLIEKLAGTKDLRNQINEGKTAEEIRASWQPELDEYKELRKQYLLYEDF